MQQNESPQNPQAPLPRTRDSPARHRAQPLELRVDPLTLQLEIRPQREVKVKSASCGPFCPQSSPVWLTSLLEGFLPESTGLPTMIAHNCNRQFSVS